MASGFTSASQTLSIGALMDTDALAIRSSGISVSSVFAHKARLLIGGTGNASPNATTAAAANRSGRRAGR
jgi:hypothetical protein